SAPQHSYLPQTELSCVPKEFESTDRNTLSHETWYLNYQRRTIPSWTLLLEHD
ncbi:hypothetical protein ACTXT7_016266, partial [Hymenolepis weldensis]